MKKKWFGILLFVIGFEALGFLSSLLSGDISAVYAALNKPPFSPPGIVFGIVWVVLYALMGYSFFLLYWSKDKSKTNALFGLIVQFLLNLLWPVLFFRFHLYWAALLAIIMMDAIVICVIKQCKQINKTAAYLLIPYLLWILFATYLNIGVAILN